MGEPGRAGARAGRRAAAVASGLAGLALLAGCSVEGEARVGHDDIAIDLVVSYELTGETWQACQPDAGYPGVAVEQLPPPGAGQVSCRLTGTLPLAGTADGPSFASYVLSVDDGHAFLLLPGAFFVRERNGSIDVAVHFPGRVVAASAGASVAGTTARWTDLNRLLNEGLAATAVTGTPAPAWLAPAGVGLALGGLAGVAARPLLGRARSRRPEEPWPLLPPEGRDPGGDEPADPPLGGTPTPPDQDPEVWARP